jgi:hypothetical protein
LLERLAGLLVVAAAVAAVIEVDVERRGAGERRNPEVDNAEDQIEPHRGDPAGAVSFEVLTGEIAGRQEQPTDRADDPPVERRDLAHDLSHDLANGRIERAVFLAATGAEPSLQRGAAVQAGVGAGDGAVHRWLQAPLC